MTTLAERRRHRRADRYQYQSWLVRRWRDRHLLMVPFHAIRYWAHQRKRPDPLCFAHCWSIERGMADVRRNYLWDWAEVKERLR